MEYTSREDQAIAAAHRAGELSKDPFYATIAHMIPVRIHLRRGDLAAAEASMRGANGVRPDDLRAGEAMIAASTGKEEVARGLVRELDGVSGITAAGLRLVAAAALRVGEYEVAERCMSRPLMHDLAPTWVRLDHELHPLLDRPAFAPRRRDATLVWPLEAPMIDRTRFKLFREVRVDTGTPEGSEVR
jgi:hypothetical protein